MTNLLNEKHWKRFLILTSCLIFIFGCALTTDRVSISLPKITAAASSKGKSVYLRSVRDNRLVVGKDLNSNVIGAKTLGGIKTPVGQVLGTDLAGSSGGRLLVENYENVAALVRGVIEDSLVKSGFDLADEKTDDAIVMDVTVDKLWVSCEHGMMMNIYSTINVTVGVLIDGSSKEIEISSNEEKKFHVASPKRYVRIFNKALEKFENNAIEAFSKLQYQSR